LKITSIDKITDCRHLNMFNITYLDANLHEKKWQIASRHSHPKCATGKFDIPDAVVIVPFHTEKKQLVIIREFRVPLGDYQYGFPAGLVDDGETIFQSVERELKEETGLKVIRFIKNSPPIYSSSGMTDESISMVYVECHGVPSSSENTSSEEIETIFVSPSEASALCQNKQIMCDVKTWLVLNTYAVSGTVP